MEWQIELLPKITAIDPHRFNGDVFPGNVPGCTRRNQASNPNIIDEFVVLKQNLKIRKDLARVSLHTRAWLGQEPAVDVDRSNQLVVPFFFETRPRLCEDAR